MPAKTGHLPEDDEKAIHDLLARLCAAWARGDGTAYANCFTGDCDYITFNGIHLRGQSENAALHAALFQGVLKNTTLSVEVVSLERIAPDVALVLTKGDRRKLSRQTYVVVKTDVGWLIRSFQNTRVQSFSVWITRWMQRRHARRTE